MQTGTNCQSAVTKKQPMKTQVSQQQLGFELSTPKTASVLSSSLPLSTESMPSSATTATSPGATDAFPTVGCNFTSALFHRTNRAHTGFAATYTTGVPSSLPGNGSFSNTSPQLGGYMMNYMNAFEDYVSEEEGEADVDSKPMTATGYMQQQQQALNSTSSGLCIHACTTSSLPNHDVLQDSARALTTSETGLSREEKSAPQVVVPSSTAPVDALYPPWAAADTHATLVDFPSSPGSLLHVNDHLKAASSSALEAAEEGPRQLLESFALDEQESSGLEEYKLLNERYVLYERELGRGSYGKVRLAFNLDGHTYYAAKVINKDRLRRHSLSGDSARATHEVDVLRHLHHPNIIALHEVINDATCRNLYLIFELAECGEVVSMTADGTVVPFDDGSSSFPENEVVRMARSLVSALAYLHSTGVAHRDIKPTNVLLTAEGKVKLIDFGCALQVGGAGPDDADATTLHAKLAGSVAFLAPELLLPCANDLSPTRSARGAELCHAYEHWLEQRGSTTDYYKADVFSLGVTLFTLLMGRLPWEAHDVASQLHAILDQPDPFLSHYRAAYDGAEHDDFPHEPSRSRCSSAPEDVEDVGCPVTTPDGREVTVSAAAVDFLRCCLRLDPAERPSMETLQQHPFLTRRTSSSTSEDTV